MEDTPRWITGRRIDRMSDTHVRNAHRWLQRNPHVVHPDDTRRILAWVQAAEARCPELRKEPITIMANRSEIIDALEQAVRDAERQIKVLSGPPDDFPDEQVIYFEKTYGGRDGARVYSFAAVKKADMWYRTGNGSHSNSVPCSWADLLDFIDGGPIWYATGYQKLQ